MTSRRCLLGLGVTLVGSSLLAQGPGAIPSQPAKSDQTVVAMVNGVPITRQQLADELIARKGRAQLEALVNRTLIEQTCSSKGITLDEKEVQDELIAEMKASASASLADFEKSMLNPQRTTLLEYRQDVIRPRLMIQKLANAQLTVTEEDLKQEFACQYGPKAAIRIITFKDGQIAKRAWSEIAGKPDQFIRVAKKQENLDLASSAGMITPFGRHTTHDVIEKRAFELKDGEISEVLQTPQKSFVIVLKEGELPAQNVTFESKKESLRQSALEKKRQTEVPKIIAELKGLASTKIQILLGNDGDVNKMLEKYEKNFAPTSR